MGSDFQNGRGARSARPAPDNPRLSAAAKASAAAMLAAAKASAAEAEAEAAAAMLAAARTLLVVQEVTL